MRKIGSLLVTVMVLTSCGSTQEAAPIVDPCVKVKESAREAAKKWSTRGEVDPTEVIGAKLEVLQWAFIVTGDAACFSDEMVATAKSAITLLSSSGN